MIVEIEEKEESHLNILFMVLNAGLAKAKFRIAGDESSIEGIALVNTSA